MPHRVGLGIYVPCRLLGGEPGFCPAEMRVDPLVVEYHAIEVLPDPFVAGAAISAADGGPVLVHATAPRVVLQVRAEAARFLTDVVRHAEVPPHMAILDLLGGEREGELAADRLADWEPLLAVNEHGFPSRLRGCVDSECDAGPRHLALSVHLLPYCTRRLEHLVVRDHPLLHQKVHEPESKRRDLACFLGVLAERGVREQAAPLELALDPRDRIDLRKFVADHRNLRFCSAITASRALA